MRNGAMPNRQHTSATPSPRATFTPTFQNKGPLWKNNGFLSIKFSLSGGSKCKVLETRLRWRGRMRLEPCQIGSIRPRRQALGRRTLPLPRPWSHLEIQWFHSLSSCQIGWIWGYACDGGDVCDWSLAKSAAHVHDAKPEGDVHSILTNPYENYRSPKNFVL